MVDVEGPNGGEELPPQDTAHRAVFPEGSVHLFPSVVQGVNLFCCGRIAAGGALGRRFWRGNAHCGQKGSHDGPGKDEE